MKEIKLKRVIPLYNQLIVTAERYSAEETAEMSGGIIRTDMIDVLKPYQTILEVADEVKTLKVGDIVAIKLDRYAQPKQKKDSLKESVDEYYNVNIEYNVPTLELKDREVLLLGSNDIKFIVADYEEIEIKSKSNIILDNPSKLIVPGQELIG
jgi:hypothetical protein